MRSRHTRPEWLSARPEEEVAVQLAALGGVDEGAPLVPAADRTLGVPRIVEEEPVAAGAQKERDGQVGPGPVAVVAVPQSPGGAVLVQAGSP